MAEQQRRRWRFHLNTTQEKIAALFKSQPPSSLVTCLNFGNFLQHNATKKCHETQMFSVRTLLTCCFNWTKISQEREFSLYEKPVRHFKQSESRGSGDPTPSVPRLKVERRPKVVTHRGCCWRDACVGWWRCCAAAACSAGGCCLWGSWR